MYKVLLWVHSNIRWFVLALLVLAIVRGFQGWFGNKEWSDTDKKVNLFTMIFVDIQLLLGLTLLGVAPTIRLALNMGMKGTMKNGSIRFWAVEHWVMMLIAVVLVHVGYAMAKRAEASVDKFKKSAIFFTIALLIIFASIPWPFMRVVRPLFRLF